MAFAFDTLGYAKRLRNAGVPDAEAEAHAEAAREFIMAELVTRYDLDVARRELEGSIAGVRQHVDTSVGGLRQHVDTSIGALRQQVDDSNAALLHRVDASSAALAQQIAASEQRSAASLAALKSDMDKLWLRLMVGMGSLIGAGIGILAMLIKLS